MWKTKQLCVALVANMLVVGVGTVYADPVRSDRADLEERSNEAFEDLDQTLNPGVDESPSVTADDEATADGVSDNTTATVDSDTTTHTVDTETVVTTREARGRTAANKTAAAHEPSQKELYERLLQEEAAGQGYTTVHDAVWVEMPAQHIPTPEPVSTTVIIDTDDGFRRRYHRSGLWYFFRHLMTERPHHIRGDAYRSHRQAKKAKRRARADRRARRVAAERKQRARAQRQARRAKVERRSRKANAKRRAAQRASKRQRRISQRRSNSERRRRSR